MMFASRRIVKASLQSWLPVDADVFVMARVLVNYNHGDEYYAAEGENLLLGPQEAGIQSCYVS